MPKQEGTTDTLTIQVPPLPEGYKAVDFRRVKSGDYYFSYASNKPEIWRGPLSTVYCLILEKDLRQEIKEWTLDQLKELIKQVEDNEIEVTGCEFGTIFQEDDSRTLTLSYLVKNVKA